MNIARSSRLRSVLMTTVLLGAVFVTALLTSGIGQGEQEASARIGVLLNENGWSFERSRELTLLIIDAGAFVIPMLEKAVSNGEDESKRVSAANLLAIIGGDAVIDILKENALTRNVPSMEAALCIARMARGNDEDVAYLIDRMSSGGREWIPAQAALGLGLLRSRTAIPQLELTANKENKDLTSSAATTALRWMSEGSRECVPDGIKESDAGVISAIFRSGIPDIGDIDHMEDIRNRGMWRLDGNSWVFAKKADDGRSGASGLRSTPAQGECRIEWEDIHISPDGKRALATVGLDIGSRISGYDYILERTGGSWIVRSMYLFRVG